MSSSRQQQRHGLMALALSGFVMLAAVASAQPHIHGRNSAPDAVIHRHSHYGRSHYGHAHKHRLARRMDNIGVGVPFMFVEGQYGVFKRSPTKTDPKQSQEATTVVVTTQEPQATQANGCPVGVSCPKDHYCTETECCPDGKICDGTTGCLDYSDPKCPDNIACCYENLPMCVTQGGNFGCAPAPQTSKQAETTTSAAPSPTSTSSPEAETTSATLAETTTIASSTTEEPTSTSTGTSTSTSESSSAETTAAAEETSANPTTTKVQKQTKSLENDPAITAISSGSPRPTKDTTSDDNGSSSIISGAVAGSIVAFAFIGLIGYIIVKKRQERELTKGDAEQSKPITEEAAPMACSSTGTTTKPVQSRPHSYQENSAEMLELSNDSAFVFAGPDGTVSTHQAPYQGAYNDKIAPPSPPPNALVVGTPPYRRPENGSHPGTPTSARMHTGPMSPHSSGPSPVNPHANRPSFPLPDHPLPPPQVFAQSRPGSHSSYQAYTPPPGHSSRPGTPGTPGTPRFRPQNF